MSDEYGSNGWTVECGDCDGFKMSDCCGMPTDPDILLCTSCHEHCGTMCDDCVIEKANEDGSISEKQ